ncbi:AfsR/SARP family transcriptional regulator [Luedemannella flava]|uniref:AfsR/SARP family transcriptional regulator n=1 Tax=Luedemannella flava TaxID=349316 RepID=UPI0031D74341
MADFRLLGAVEIWAAGQPIDAGQPRQRAVLAALLVDAGQVVTVGELADRVWGKQPPREAAGTLRAHVARIRRTLERAETLDGDHVRLTHTPGGYVLHVEPDRVDLHRFRRLAGQARQPTHPEEQRTAWLREAVGLWRGQPLTGLAGEWAGRMRQSWDREWLDAVVAWANAELAVGNAGAALGTLTELADRHPLVESLAAALMRTLCAVGRPADALEQYAATRQRLVDELGVDPGAELQALHQAILRGDAVLPGGPAATRPPTVASVVPAQLPGDVAAFAGRVDHLAHLDKLLSASASAPPRAVVISAVSGTAGIGKTTLAVHWAHRTADTFPDGQLYVNLRGFDPGGEVTTPNEAIRGFLDALGVPSERVPPDLSAQVALYRSLMAGRRMLVLLDNARDAAQVRPLLPATPGTLALITSRNQLTPLAAVEGATLLTLDALSESEARELLAARLGDDRLAAEPDATDRILRGCAGLPLALSIAAARAQQSGFPLAALAAELDSAADRLDALDAGDPATQVRTVFSWSYATLSPDAARLFRLLGLDPGPDISAAAAAGLAGRDAGRLLTELTRASLLIEHAPGRYTMHDLLRAYAADLAGEQDTSEERRAATRRLLDHYAHTAHAASRVLYPHRDPVLIPMDEPAKDSRPVDLADRAAATAWLAAEHPVLLGAIRYAVGDGFDRHAWWLAWALDTFLYRQGHWHELAEAWEAALRAARWLANSAAEAYAYHRRARPETRFGRYDEARVRVQQALSLYVTGGDLIGQADAHHSLATIWELEGDFAAALDHVQQSAGLYGAAGHRRGQAVSLANVGWFQARLGDLDPALDSSTRARELLRALGDRTGEAGTLLSLGYIHDKRGRHAEAAEVLAEAVDVYRELGDRYYEATASARLGDSYLAAGDATAGRDALRAALRIFTDLGQSEAEAIREKLRG